MSNSMAVCVIIVQYRNELIYLQGSFIVGASPEEAIRLTAQNATLAVGVSTSLRVPSLGYRGNMTKVSVTNN